MQVTLDDCIDEGVSIFATFRVSAESHTVGHLLENRIASYSHTGIYYVAYTLRHPLDPYILLKIRAIDYVTAVNAIMSACDGIIQDLQTVKNEMGVY